ncbi:GGDEF domain-containing protein [Butyrivibrio sp. VCB2006]|uniref:GGDEF domain-containing protein n=1 Tax=Butyrivibrio sp. VCB2006 TaxID=1280679 RepID=UPI00049246E6|nr:GGDEF domain-containing protein [Butyrivibrio sp. VCB2006]
MEYVFYYVMAQVASIFLLGIVLFKIHNSVNKQLSQVYLGNLIFVLMLYFGAEIFWSIVDGGIIASTKPLLYLSNIFTYVLLGIAAYQWYLLSEAIQKNKAIESNATKLILSIPVWLSTILCVTAYRTGLAYYVDENGALVGGRLYVILIIVPFGYMIAASVKAFGRAFNKDKYAERNLYFMIGFFPIAPIVLGIAQAAYWRAPFLCYGAVAAVFYVYTSIQDNLISLDPLTQVNNRNQMYKYLTQKMKNPDPGLSLFLLIIDVDKFKGINDTYGHIEGDNALVMIADAIKSACQGPRNRFFVSRYGGDEFVVVAEMGYRAEATWLAEQIRTNVRKISGEHSLSYPLNVSVGIAQYDFSEPVSIQSFIARADSDLYKQKKLNAG